MLLVYILDMVEMVQTEDCVMSSFLSFLFLEISYLLPRCLPNDLAWPTILALPTALALPILALPILALPILDLPNLPLPNPLFLFLFMFLFLFLFLFLFWFLLAALLPLTRPSSSAGACSTLPSMRSPSKLLASAETLMKTRIVPRMRRQTFIP